MKAYCLDENGDIVYSLTQWDYNQKLIVDCGSFTFSTAPSVQFCNCQSTKALCVDSTITDNQIVADIPNILLQSPLKIIAYIVATSGDALKTVYTVEIPVHKRVKPDSYTYSDNTELVELKEIASSLQTLESTISANEQIRISQETVRQENNEKLLETIEEAKSASDTALTSASKATTETAKAITAIEDANDAAEKANAAASAVADLTSGLNAIIDDETGEEYILGIESGLLYLKPATDE